LTHHHTDSKRTNISKTTKVTLRRLDKKPNLDKTNIEEPVHRIKQIDTQQQQQPSWRETNLKGLEMLTEFEIL
jgi:hypothetical protein